ncbi:MAG TPA: iron-containing alcohol dehydrogenase [Actinoplanes sp.]|nr:iron-containing alcohol dehydrogenase [Actinoplanes sp.]
MVFGDVRYPYYLGQDCLDRIAWHLGRCDPDRFLVISDETVLGLHGDRFISELSRFAPVTPFGMPAGEGIKTAGALVSHLEGAIAAGASRRSVVVAFGGGVPGNLAGLVAALLFRGLRLAHVPTTTVAAMDSTISLKQAINSSRGKNHIGLYHTPHAVFTDVDLLRTLPERELRSGLCEATKNCLTLRPGSIPQLREVLRSDRRSAETLLWLLEESLRAKTKAMATDANEQRDGLILEYGHTVGHAVEMCDYRRRAADGVSHGEAVAIGMRAAARVAASVGEMNGADVDLHDELVAALGGPFGIPGGIEVDDVMAVVRADNKRGYLNVRAGETAMVLLRRPGDPLGTAGCPLTAVDEQVVADAVQALMTADQPEGARL